MLLAPLAVMPLGVAVGLVLAVQRADDLAIRCGLERVRFAQFVFQRLVVVDFTVDGESVSFSGVIQRLRAGVDVDD